MSDMVMNGVAFFHAQRHARMSHDVEYVRGDTAVPLKATIARPRTTESGGEELLIDADQRDYVFRVEDLVSGGNPLTPELGDVIADGGTEWELGRSEGSPLWEFGDPAHTTYRVHCNRISEVGG